MAKMWVGRTDGKTDKTADIFNASLSFDSRMYKEDIEGSIAHARMLSKCSIITDDECNTLVKGLEEIMSDIESGSLSLSSDAEDIHMFVEEELTRRVGNVGKKVHTARSRNDQVSQDLRMYLRKKSGELDALLSSLISTLSDRAEEHKDTIMPGYTHLQKAQPVTFGHHLLAYAVMFLRDRERLKDALKRINISPIGSCALAGTTYETDREMEASLLGFDGITENSMDGVSDRDYALEMLFDLSLIMMHLSRLSEELVLWTSWEFGFVSLSSEYTTGSSIMPQKKNSDMAELIRGKTGRVYGSLIALLTVLKGLPLAYNKDMQEDKEGLFDALDTAEMSLSVMTGMIATLSVNKERMLISAKEGFINATDLADYLVKKGLPFRSAYKIVGEIVANAIERGFVLETYPMEKYKEHSPLFDLDLYDAIDLKKCVEKRKCPGAPGAFDREINYVRRKNNES